MRSTMITGLIWNGEQCLPAMFALGPSVFSYTAPAVHGLEASDLYERTRCGMPSQDNILSTEIV